MSFSVLATSAETQVPASRRPLRVLGIDLGTTNSAVAEIIVPADGAGALEARCLDIEQSTLQGPDFHTLVPSVLALHDGQVYVGAGAKDLRARVSDFKLERNRNIFWDCKNDIGVRRTYHKAPVGFRSAKEIAGRLLKFLMDATPEGGSPPADTTVVTVPASFQAAQRQDTLNAAQLAGIKLPAGALLDEPVAAFLDYAQSHGKETFAGMSEPLSLVVFDFGGGTCDVALFELRKPSSGATASVGVAPLSVSRYHRLGGSDIDRAIVVEVLIPQIIKQNNDLESHDLDYRIKSDRVIPALLGCAESLKIGLCKEIARLKKLSRYDEEQSKLIKKNPSVYDCTLQDGSKRRLQSPTLSAIEFDKVLKPFLDRDLLYPRETDYLMTCSVFAPLKDALERAKLAPKDIDFCLLVGGSALIPQIAEAVGDFFAAAKLLRFDDAERTQTAVARGAAWQALSLAIRGQGLVRPVNGDSISILTENGPMELIGDGTELPHPVGGDWAENDHLVVPKTSLTDNVPLRVELRSGDGRVLLCKIWMIPPGGSKGDLLRLRYRMDANHVLHLRLSRKDEDDPAQEFKGDVENPLTNVVNPNAARDRILDLEEQMRTGDLPKNKQRETVGKIADLEADLGHYEKALDLLSRLNRITPDAGVLNRMGIIAGRLGDYERQEKLYRSAAQIPPGWSGPLFNLALSQQNQDRLTEAVQTIDEVIAREPYPGPSSLVLKARLIGKLGQSNKKCDVLLEQAFDAFDPPADLSDFELTWYLVGARLARDSTREQEAYEERQRREKSPEAIPEGVLPHVKGEITGRPR